jgi:hypothetical protein
MAKSTTPITPSLDEVYRAVATNTWSSEDLEIDIDAAVSIGEAGAWVRAWVWVSNGEPEVQKIAPNI